MGQAFSRSVVQQIRTKRGARKTRTARKGSSAGWGWGGVQWPWGVVVTEIWDGVPALSHRWSFHRNSWCTKIFRFTRFHSNIEFPSQSRGNNNQLLVPITLVVSAEVLLVLLPGAEQSCTNTPSRSLFTRWYVNKKIELLKLLVSSKTSDQARQNWSYLRKLLVSSKTLDHARQNWSYLRACSVNP